MAQSASDHRKDPKKERALVSVYSCDLLWNDNGGSSGDQDDILGLYASHQWPQSKIDLRAAIESRARELLVEGFPYDKVKQFLKQIPWARVRGDGTTRVNNNTFQSTHQQQEDSAYVIFGTYVHGGVVGVTRVTKQHVWLTRLLVHVIKSQCPDMQVTSMCVSKNVGSPPHRDAFNMDGAHNVVIGLQCPRRGGQVWIQSHDTSTSARTVWKPCGSKELPGLLHTVRQPVTFDPKQWHATAAWSGNRMVLVGYSLKGFMRLPEQDVAHLRFCGFPLPKRTLSSRQALRLRNPSELGSQCLVVDLPDSVDDGSHLPLQGRTPEPTSATWRNPSIQLDEDPVVSSPSGAAGGEQSQRDDHREGSSHHSEQVQDQTGDSRSPGVLQSDLLEPCHIRPAEGPYATTLDGDTGERVARECDGVRQVQCMVVCRDPHQRPVLLDMVHSHSDRERGCSLEVETLRNLGPERDPLGEGGDGRDGVKYDSLRVEQEHSEPRLHSAHVECSSIRDHRGLMGCHHDSTTSGEQRAGGQDQEVGRGASQHQGVDQELHGIQCRGRESAAEEGQGREHHRQVDPQHDQEDARGSDSDIEEPVSPGDLCRLSFQTAKMIGKTYEECMVGSVEGLCKSRVMLVEVGGPEGSSLSRECESVFGKGSVLQLSFWNGGDIETAEGRKYVLGVIKDVCPRWVWFHGDSKAYSPAQRMNMRSSSHVQSLQAKQDRADKKYEGLAELFRAVSDRGTTCVLEMSECCEAWKREWFQGLEKDCELYHGVCQGCQVNLRDYQGALVCRGWKLACSNGSFVQNMSLVCDQKHAKSRPRSMVGKDLQGYPKEFSRRVVRYMERCEEWSHMALDMRKQAEICSAVEHATGQEELEPAPTSIQDIPSVERKRIFSSLRRIHVATGHCSISYMRNSLKKRGVSKDVLRCLIHFRCDVCAERARPDPRSQATLYEVAAKWHTLQCDAFSWNHPETNDKWQFMLGIDEGSRLRVGRLLFQHQTKTPSASDFIEYFEGHWLPRFGKPQLLRLDPAGCFRSKALDTYLLERQVEVSHIPAEAHWQISLIERAVQTVKDMMTALTMEQPSMNASEAFYRSLWACNHRDQYRGYSPLQHAFGRSPNEFGQLGESLVRDVPILTEHGVSAEFGLDAKAMVVAEKAFSGNRPMKNFCPGDLVYVWRRMAPKQDGSKHFKGGRFVGPYRVLATETRAGDDRQLRAISFGCSGGVSW